MPAAAEAPAEQSLMPPSTDGREFIKTAFEQAFGPDSVKSAGEKQASTRVKEPEARAKVPAEPDKAKPEVTPDSNKEEPKAEEELTPEVEAEEVPETEEQDEEVSTDGLTPEARKALVKYKTEAKTYKKELADLRKQQTEFSTTSAELKRLQGELEAKTKVIEEANKELYISRVEATPEWKAGVAEPLKQIIEQVESVATLNKIDPNKLMTAVDQASRGDRALLKELTEGMEDWDKNDLHSLSKNLIQVDKRINELKSNSKEAYETSMRKQQEQSEQGRQQLIKEYQKAADTVSERFAEAVKDILPEDHGINFDALKSEAQTIDNWKPDEKVYAGYAAVALPEAIKHAKALIKELAETKAQLTKFRNGGAKANTSGSAPGSPKDAAKPKTREEVASQSFDDYGAQAAARIMRGVGVG